MTYEKSTSPPKIFYDNLPRKLENPQNFAMFNTYLGKVEFISPIYANQITHM